MITPTGCVQLRRPWSKDPPGLPGPPGSSADVSLRDLQVLRVCESNRQLIPNVTFGIINWRLE